MTATLVHEVVGGVSARSSEGGAPGARTATARTAFERPARVPGWDASRWGYDVRLECFWAELARPGGDVVRIGPEHLLTTVPALARAVADRARLDWTAAYLALTA